MRAKFINEFERGKSPKDAMDMGKKRLTGDFDQHLKDIKDMKDRMSDDEKELENLQHLYVFIYRPSFEPIEIEGEEFHKKTIEIENLYQIDRYDKGDLLAIEMMKMRATAQGDGSKLALVDIPSFMHDQKTAYDSEISPELKKYIIENKRKAFG